MRTLESMSKADRNLLLFLETRAVDHAGKVDAAHMNAADMLTAQTWDKQGFVSFGRIASDFIVTGNLGSRGSHWCILSPEAWSLAHGERRNRAARTWKDRAWRTTQEKREVAK